MKVGPLNEGDAALHAALDVTLAEFGISITGDGARAAAGRLVALEIASRLGLRAARRILSMERQLLLGSCLHGASAAESEHVPTKGLSVVTGKPYERFELVSDRSSPARRLRSSTGGETCDAGAG
jgi:hypothetical protein